MASTRRRRCRRASDSSSASGRVGQRPCSHLDRGLSRLRLGVFSQRHKRSHGGRGGSGNRSTVAADRSDPCEQPPAPHWVSVARPRCWSGLPMECRQPWLGPDLAPGGSVHGRAGALCGGVPSGSRGHRREATHKCLPPGLPRLDEDQDPVVLAARARDRVAVARAWLACRVASPVPSDDWIDTRGKLAPASSANSRSAASSVSIRITSAAITSVVDAVEGRRSRLP